MAVIHDDAMEQHRQEPAAVFESTLRQRTTGAWWQSLREAGAWCAPVHRLEDLPGDEQVLANGYLARFPDGFVGSPAPFEVTGWRGARSVAGA